MGRNQPGVKRRPALLEDRKLELGQEAGDRPGSARSRSTWHRLCLMTRDGKDPAATAVLHGLAVDR